MSGLNRDVASFLAQSNGIDPSAAGLKGEGLNIVDAGIRRAVADVPIGKVAAHLYRRADLLAVHGIEAEGSGEPPKGQPEVIAVLHRENAELTKELEQLHALAAKEAELRTYLRKWQIFMWLWIGIGIGWTVRAGLFWMGL